MGKKNLNENCNISTVLKRVCAVFRIVLGLPSHRLFCCSALMHIIYLSRHNLSLTLSRFICIELQGEESSVAFVDSLTWS